MSTKPPDENDRARAGTLPGDPSQGTEKVRLHVARPGDHRPPTEPCDLLSERALLGALLWCGQNAPDQLRVSAVTDILENGDPFYEKAHQFIFEALLALAREGVNHEPVAVFRTLGSIGADRAVGGLEGVRRLLDDAGSLNEVQARYYATSIRGKWARREAVRIAKEVIAEAMSSTSTDESLFEKAVSLPAVYGNRTAETGAAATAREAAGNFYHALSTPCAPWLSSGFRDVDDMMAGGWRRQESYIVAARTSIGKSLFAAQLAEKLVSISPNDAVMISTLEMSKEKYIGRIVSARSGVPRRAIRMRNLTPEQMSAVFLETQRISTLPLFFVDNESQTLGKVYAAARQLHAKLARQGKRLGMVIVDHLGLVKASTESLRRADRRMQVSETSRGLRWIARQLDCAVVAAVQITRAFEGDSRYSVPQLHHLKDSGSIEEDADNVLILHRAKDESTGMFLPDYPMAVVLEKAREDDRRAIVLDIHPITGQLSDSDKTFSECYGRKAQTRASQEARKERKPE